MRTRSFSFGGILAATLLIGASSASAQLPSADQKCIDGYNNKLRLVSAQAGKSARSCVKNAAKGAEANPNNCIVTNPDGKIAGKQAKVTDLYTSLKCTGSEPIQQGAATGNAAHEDGIIDFANDLFGDPVTTAIVGVGKVSAKCLDKAFQRPTQAFTELVKAHRSCKKNAMKAGTVTSSATLDAQCGTFAQIDAGGKAAAKFSKSASDITAACVGTEEPLATLFPGLDGACHASGATLATCINTAAKCRACETLNAADGQDIDCDVLDNNAADGSCGIPQHLCTLAPASALQIHIEALPVPLNFALGGTLNIGAAGSVATCDIATLNPINIPAIGLVCITPSAGCPQGARDCDGGDALGITLSSDGNTGACASEAACDASCDTFCGGAANVQTAACTGFCSLGTNQACTNDADCLPSNGACNGPDPVGVNNGICQCACINRAAHGASAAGDFQCNLGSVLNVETAAPCDGVDVSIGIGTTCVPFSTQRANSTVVDANFGAGTVPPAPNVNDLNGANVACATLDASTTTGITAVGVVNFFGSSLGDLATGLTAVCQ